MRQAELARVREALAKRRGSTASPQFDNLEFSGLRGFEDASVQPCVGFLTICGGTGAGKTALLETLYYALRSPDDPPAPNLKRIEGAHIKVSVSGPNGNYCIQKLVNVDDADDDADAGYAAGARLLSLDERTVLFRNALAGQDVEILKEGIGSVSLNREALDILGFCCGKRYVDAKFYEIEIGDRMMPFFEVHSEGHFYNSLTMATGELSSFYIAWTALNASPFGILLIEEPEAHLPPRNHAAVFGMIGKFALEKHLAVVLSTHAPSIACEVPEKNLLSIRRSEGKSLLPSRRDIKNKVLNRLGLTPSNKVVAFVEDYLSKAITYEIIEMYEMSIFADIEIIVHSDGSGGIHKALKGIPTAINTCSFVGILDGDMREEIATWKVDHPLVLLPFATAMEEELLEAGESRTKQVAQTLGREMSRIHDALNAAAGENYHDRFVSVAKSVGVSQDYLVKALFREWMKTPGKRRLVRDFVLNFAKCSGINLPDLR